MENEITVMIVRFFTSNIRLSTPILLAALGMVYNEKAGIVNIGAEGMMLIGALTGVLCSYFFESAVYGAVGALAAGALCGLIFAFIVVTMQGNQIVTGIAFNLLGLGITTSVSRIVFTASHRPAINAFTTVAIPLFSKIPIIGPIFFIQSLVVYFTVFLVIITWFLLYQTTWGLKVRSVGEVPKAADTLGVNVYKVRYQCMIIGGALAGLGGAFLSLGVVSLFTENMVAGRGFIAIAVVIFGKYSPVGVLLASLLFGAGDSVVFRLQAMGTQIPYQFIRMIPYVITICALAGFVGKTRPPAAGGVPYDKE